MVKNSLILLFSFSLLIIFSSCGTSTGTRYTQEESKSTKEKVEAKKVKEYPEDFDLTRYRAKISAPKINKDTAGSADFDAWYNYHSVVSKDDTNKTAVQTVPGYRVQVISTDRLDQANTIRSEIYFKTNQKAVYVKFDPPFYKVEVGDFIDINDAKNLVFKFKQMGYKDARVVNETINIFE